MGRSLRREILGTFLAKFPTFQVGWVYLATPGLNSRPVARRAAQTVLLPVHNSVPSSRVRAFFQEGLEKSTCFWLALIAVGYFGGNCWSD